MLNSCLFVCFLHVCAASAFTTHTAQQLSNNNSSSSSEGGDGSTSTQHVPLNLSNISNYSLNDMHQLHHTEKIRLNTINQVTKVPLRSDASFEYPNIAVAASLIQQSSASLFANYNNKQNVLQLARNIDAKLKNVRNLEMHVDWIQEIFDSIHYNNGPAFNFLNYSEQELQQRVKLQQDLQIFSKRLAKKLQKATHLVLELHDFLRFNITKVLVHFYRNESTTSAKNKEHLNLYLNTYIEACQPTLERNSNYEDNTNDNDDNGGIYADAGINYNKQQIQILNYLKTDDFTPAFLNENNTQSMAVNTYIAIKLEELWQRLNESDLFEEDKSNKVGHDTGKLKFLGNHYKHIYFLSKSDGAINANMRISEFHFRQLYVSAIKNKYVLLLIDIGSALNAELLDLSKSFVANIIKLLSETDYISVVTIASEANYLYLNAYPKEATHGIYPATRARKDELLGYINNLSISKAFTNHTHGFQYAFEFLYKLQNASFIHKEQPIQFIYVTRGLLSNLSDATHVLRVLAYGQSHLIAPVIINTCAVVLDEKRIMYEKQFLSDIALQNYTKYDINVRSWLSAEQQLEIAGKFFVLTKTQPSTLLSTSTRIFEQLFDERYLSDSYEVHAPFVQWDSRDVIVPITHAVPPYGIVGVNLYLADLIEDIINYQQTQLNYNKNDGCYAFLIDRNTGYTLAHPAFPRPFLQSQTSFPVDISYLENATDFVNIRKNLLSTESGNLSTTVYLTTDRKNSVLMQRNYFWQNVLDIYVLCLVSTNRLPATTNISMDFDEQRSTFQLPVNKPFTLQRFMGKENLPQFSHKSYEYMPPKDLLYHRLDLYSPTNTKICRYFRQIATFAAPTLFLSATAFESPFTFQHNNRLSTQETQDRTREAIMLYIKDRSGLIANPGLRPQIRNEVIALYRAMQYLKKRHQEARGLLRNYVIRRYIATTNGVLQVYPGCLLSTNYDATRRPWFYKAIQQPGKIMSTEPYLDAGGAGYIITIAHTIFEGNLHTSHSSEYDRPGAVVALDVPYAFFYKLIIDTTSFCLFPNIKCLLFEQAGFLIAHPSMMEPSTLLRNQRRPHEHLTHKESYLANDILNHKTLVQKLGCSNYQNRTLQRYYAFNTSLSDILTNVVHGERTKYAISLIRGTNIFAAVLNSTCDGGAFCPCSTINRICLNCNRMDQTDCECPCECPMEPDTSDTYVNYTKQFPFCEPPSEHFIALAPTTDTVHSLRSCMHINCDLYITQSECLAVMGCEWCQQDLDGNTFSASFCTAQASCFNGVLGSLTPYGDFFNDFPEHNYNPQQKLNTYSALGPVGGAIIVLVIVIAFSIYCYRHSLDAQEQDQFYMDSVQEENYGLPLSRFNFDDCQTHDEPPGGGHGYDHVAAAAAQRNLINPADISPYHVSTGSSYRRPPNGESDHGYSTMTPHEDSSDHQCFTLAEPLLLHDKRNSKSDTISISTSISSPTNRHHQTHPYLSNQPQLPVVSKDILRYSTPKEHISPTHGYDDAIAEQTLPFASPHYILAPVTVHRHMETSES